MRKNLDITVRPESMLNPILTTSDSQCTCIVATCLNSKRKVHLDLQHIRSIYGIKVPVLDGKISAKTLILKDSGISGD
jgi:hypothetical protein